MKEIVFDDLESLLEYVEDDIENVMLTEITEEIKDKEVEVIEEVVYGAYDPLYYQRRREQGGLMDKDNMTSYIEKYPDGEIVLFVENDTKVSPATYDSDRNDDLDIIIENGMGGNEPYSKPRRFTEETQNRIDREMVLERALKRNLDYIE